MVVCEGKCLRTLLPTRLVGRIFFSRRKLACKNFMIGQRVATSSVVSVFGGIVRCLVLGATILG